MSTTQIFVELLITGIGGLVWMVILICSLTGVDVEFFLNKDFSTFYIIPISAFAYVIGILTDRIGYEIFIKHESKCLHGKNIDIFPKDKNGRPDPDPIIFYIKSRSDYLESKILYNRSRLRLCRSWILNFLLIMLSLIVYAFPQTGDNNKIIFILAGLSLVLSIITFFIWKTLSKDFYNNIISGYYLLKDESVLKEKLNSPTLPGF